MRFLLAFLCVALLSGQPVRASEAETVSEERFTFAELRVPLADSGNPMRIMAVQLMLVMASPEAKSTLRSRQKDLIPTLASSLSKMPTRTATKPDAPIEIKKTVAAVLEEAGIAGITEVLVQKYVVW